MPLAYKIMIAVFGTAFIIRLLWVAYKLLTSKPAKDNATVDDDLQNYQM